jgi:hypothetical protein
MKILVVMVILEKRMGGCDIRPVVCSSLVEAPDVGGAATAWDV